MVRATDILSVVDQHLNANRFREQHWEGSFSDYLDVVMENPNVARNAFQRARQFHGIEKRHGGEGRNLQ